MGVLERVGKDCQREDADASGPELHVASGRDVRPLVAAGILADQERHELNENLNNAHEGGSEPTPRCIAFSHALSIGRVKRINESLMPRSLPRAESA